MLRRVALGLVIPLVLLTGCGNSRTRPPDLARPALPRATTPLAFPGSGFSVRAPSNWEVVDAKAPPLIVTVFSGRALVAVWRYPRTAPLPDTGAALAAARSRLIDAVRGRDPSLRLIRSKLLAVDGDRAIELDAIERIAGQTRRVRSLHVFAFGAELVLDEYAPPNMFRTVDHDVFSPLKRSLQVFPVRTA